MTASKEDAPNWINWTLVVLLVLGILSMPVLFYIKYTDSKERRQATELPADNELLLKIESEEVYNAVKYDRPTQFLGTPDGYAPFGHPQFPVKCEFGEYQVSCITLLGEQVEPTLPATATSLMRNQSVLYDTSLTCGQGFCVDNDTKHVVGRVSLEMQLWLVRNCDISTTFGKYDLTTCTPPLK